MSMEGWNSIATGAHLGGCVLAQTSEAILSTHFCAFVHYFKIHTWSREH